MIEAKVDELTKRFGLSSMHIFNQNPGWKVFGFRVNARKHEASIENGIGENVMAALLDFEARLLEGPIHAPRSQ